MTKSTFITIAFDPRDRAALARSAHAHDCSPAELIEKLVIEWLNTENLRTVPIPETPGAASPRKLKRKTVPIVANQNRFDVT